MLFWHFEDMLDLAKSSMHSHYSANFLAVVSLLFLDHFYPFAESTFVALYQ